MTSSAVLPPPSDLNSSLTDSMDVGEYDSDGAAMFMIVVILTYTLSIIALIATFTFRKKNAVIQDQEATNYLKYRSHAFQVLSKMEVERARKYGIRCAQSSIPMPFLLIPVANGNTKNLLSMAKAEKVMQGLASPKAKNQNAKKGGLIYQNEVNRSPMKRCSDVNGSALSIKEESEHDP